MTDEEAPRGGDDWQRTSQRPLRFLSTGWFDAVKRQAPQWVERPGRSVVLEQVVEGTPDGTVRYRVEASSGTCRIIWPVDPEAAQADLTVTCDWGTAAAIASGELNAGVALTQGRLKVRGNPLAIDLSDSEACFADPVPSEVRRSTIFSAAGGPAMLGEP
ncbi:MAG: SCP2 sterol-binding domain-containing protein [Acidimicrobiales bacterium]